MLRVSIQLRPQDVPAFAKALGAEPCLQFRGLAEWRDTNHCDTYDALVDAHHEGQYLHGLPFVAMVSGADNAPYSVAYDGGTEHSEEVRSPSSDTTGYYRMVFAAQDAIGDAVELADKAERRAAATERGSIALHLLAFQLAVALAIGSGVLSVLAWAQAALGGVL